MKMMPGQTPYTNEQESRINMMLMDACAATEEFDEDELERHADQLRMMEKVSKISRERCVELLKAVCIQCYDDETVEILRVAVIENVLDGTINDMDLE